MKKIMPIIFILTLMACGKNINTNGGSWIFHNQTYKATQAFYVLGGLTAYTGTGVPTGSLALWFRDSAGYGTNWPPHLHTYTLCKSYPPDSGQVFMQLTDTSIRNSWVITGNTTPYVTVAPYHDSLITVNIPTVMVVNTNDSIQLLVPPFSYFYIGKPSGTDSSLVSGTVIQTY
jgi:hypothetical protein